MKFFTKEVQIACVAILGVVVLFFGLQFLKGLNIFSTEDTYYVAFDDISGLSASSPVYADGYKVGVVKDIIYNYGTDGDIIAAVGLDKNMRLPKGSTAEIESDMLGNIKVNLLLASNPLERVAPGDTIRGNKEIGMLSKAADMIPAVEKMLPKMDSILTSLNALLADPALANSLHNVDAITGNLAVTTKQLNALTASLNKRVPGMLDKADKVLTNTDRITKNISDVDIAATMTKVNNTLSNVEQMTAALNSKEGTLGLLMRDPQLYYNLSATMRDADSLMIDLRQHPKRYVHFSIFGKKDK
ncbi:MAG: MlaD family protein [Prevotella sp.]|nr:MlaD family protein [Prevotella sp.]MDE6354629.1 MlaD family protein [Prevotella sp.]